MEDYETDENANDSDDEFYETVASATFVIQTYYQKYLNKVPCMTSPQTGNKWLQEILKGHRSRCYHMFRMEKEVYFKLLHELEIKYGLSTSRNIGAAEKLGMLLYILGGGLSNRQTRERFQHSGWTVSHYFNEVLDKVCNMAMDIIKPDDPKFKEVPKEIRTDTRYYPYFKDVIGAIDGVHIPAIVSPQDQVPFIGRKGVPTQNVMAVCNFDMRFTFVLAGWEGTAQDTRIFSRALNTPELKFPFPPEGKYYLVDAGYPQLNGYLGPYKGERYHLPDFCRTGGPSGYQEVFNHAHSSLRSVIERSFGVLKKRWKILKDMPSYKFEKQVKIVVATMALHNFIRENATRDRRFSKYSRPDVVLEEEEEDVQGEEEYATHPGSSSSDSMTHVRNSIALSLVKS